MSGNKIVTDSSGIPIAYHCFCCRRFGLPASEDDGLALTPLHCACCRHMNFDRPADFSTYPDLAAVAAQITANSVHSYPSAAIPLPVTLFPAGPVLDPYPDFPFGEIAPGRREDCAQCQAHDRLGREFQGDDESDADETSDVDSEATLVEAFERSAGVHPAPEAARNREPEAGPSESSAVPAQASPSAKTASEVASPAPNPAAAYPPAWSPAVDSSAAASSRETKASVADDDSDGLSVVSFSDASHHSA